MGELDTKKARAILEEIGLAAFNNGGRKARGGDIDKRVSSRNQNDPALDIQEKYDYLKGKKSTGFVAAFYFTGSADFSPDKTVEFVHRSFSDYLAAQGLIYWADIWSENPDTFFEKWFDLCGNADLEENVLTFIEREFSYRLENKRVTKDQLIDLKDRLICCFHKALLGDVPLGGNTLQEAIDRANRGETIMFCIIAKLAFVTQTRWNPNKPDWKKDDRHFARWLHRIEDLKDPWKSHICTYNFDYISLEGINLKRCNLITSSLFNASLANSQLQEVGLYEANLREADLSGAILSGADLSGTNLRRANLRRANLRRANLIIADLSGADLSGTDLSGADLSDADLSDADLSRAYYLEDYPPIGLKDAIQKATERGVPSLNADKMFIWRK
ncbi:MAG: pentapeptide repeat-containing protein [Methylocystaceae bacterium]|nr:pentapeptide repeat-containing protein [Methylocystaceae bacterium]